MDFYQDLRQVDVRDSLHSDAENYDVFCERCQRVHKHFTFTKEDYDLYLVDAAHQLNDAIDAEIGTEILRTLGLNLTNPQTL